MFQYLRALGLAPIEWNEAVALTRKGAPFIYEIVDAGLQEAHAVVVLLTGDDITHLRSELAGGHHLSAPETPTPQARPNVLFEAGMALGRMPTRTALVTLGQLRPFSDIAGMHAIEMSNASTHRVALAERLRTIGCPVNTSATEWLTAGDFNAAVPAGPFRLPPSPTGYDRITAKTTGKVLDVEYPPSSQVHQVEWLSAGNQKWFPLIAADGFYFLFVQSSGKCLDVEFSRPDDRARVIEFPFNGSDAQKWELRDSGKGCVSLIAKCSGKALHFEEGTDRIYQFTCNGSPNQQWTFHPCHS